MSSSSERKRKIKFSNTELELLVEEVVKVHTQLFGKLSLTMAESAKRKLWLHIVERVNAVGVTSRSMEDLKKRFYDLRSQTKRKLAELHKQAGVTGGGRNPAPPLTELEELVASTIEPDSVVGLGAVDSSARAKSKGAPSAKQGTSTPGTAAAREESEEAGPSHEQPSQDEEDTSGIAQEEETGLTPDLPHSPHLSQSPALVFSPETSPVMQQAAPATPPARRRLVATLPLMEAALDQAEQTPPMPHAAPQANTDEDTMPRRRRMHSTAGGTGEGTVFRGLEGSMVRIQRMQGRSIQACHRQFRALNQTVGEMGKGITDIANCSRDMVKSNDNLVAGITSAITQLCDKMDHIENTRRRDTRATNRALNRLATATAQLCRRGNNMQESLTQNTAERTPATWNEEDDSVWIPSDTVQGPFKTAEPGNETPPPEGAVTSKAGTTETETKEVVGGAEAYEEDDGCFQDAEKTENDKPGGQRFHAAPRHVPTGGAWLQEFRHALAPNIANLDSLPEFSPIEAKVFMGDLGDKKVSRIYQTLVTHCSSTLLPLRTVWETDVGPMDEDDWREALESPRGTAIAIRLRNSGHEEIKTNRNSSYTSAIGDVDEAVTSLPIRILEAESRFSSVEDQMNGILEQVDSVSREKIIMENKIEELEHFSHRSNLWIVGFSERLEGADTLNWVASFMKKVMIPAFSGDLTLTRAHRVPAHLPPNLKFPLTILVNFADFRMKEKMLSKAIQTRQFEIENGAE
ncbi:uncharacterized protein LOC144827957 [Lissotriton helveticus]